MTSQMLTTQIQQKRRWPHSRLQNLLNYQNIIANATFDSNNAQNAKDIAKVQNDLANSYNKALSSIANNSLVDLAKANQNVTQLKEELNTAFTYLGKAKYNLTQAMNQLLLAQAVKALSDKAIAIVSRQLNKLQNNTYSTLIFGGCQKGSYPSFSGSLVVSELIPIGFQLASGHTLLYGNCTNKNALVNKGDLIKFVGYLKEGVTQELSVSKLSYDQFIFGFILQFRLLLQDKLYISANNETPQWLEFKIYHNVLQVKRFLHIYYALLNQNGYSLPLLSSTESAWVYLDVFYLQSSYKQATVLLKGAMKTSESFFPTRTHHKSRQIHQDRTYQVVKLTETSFSSAKIATEPANIFRDNSNPPNKEQTNKQYFRPVGGRQLFKKFEQGSKEKSNDNRKLSKRSVKDNTQKNISSSQGPRFKREPQDGVQIAPLRSILQNKEFQKSSQLIPQELLKSHATYDPYKSASKITFTPKSSMKSQNMHRPLTSNGQRHQKWAAVQRKQYQDKSALLNEINYSKPLIEVYGDRYFQYMLRNRFQDDLKPHPYVYLLSNKNFTQSRAINKLRRTFVQNLEYRPEIKQKEMIFIRGRKLKPEVQEM